MKVGPMNKPYYMYVILTADNTFYGGFTDDVGRRFATHQAGKGAKYTRPSSRHPLKLLYAEAFPDKHAALSAEAKFKRLKRPEKEAYLRERGVTDFRPEKP
jgi:putative endonuclease